MTTDKPVKAAPTIGQYLKAKRVKKGIDLKSMKLHSGVAISTICRIEAGAVPHLESLEAIGAVFGMKASAILKACGK